MAAHLGAGVRPGRVAGDDDALVLDGPGVGQQRPVRDPPPRPGGRDDEHLGPRVELRAVELGEAQVVTGGQARGHGAAGPVRQLGRDDLLAGLHELRLARAEPEPVDLPVGRLEGAVRGEDQRRVPEVLALRARTAVRRGLDDRAGVQRDAGVAGGRSSWPSRRRREGCRRGTPRSRRRSRPAPTARAGPRGRDRAAPAPGRRRGRPGRRHSRRRRSRSGAPRPSPAKRSGVTSRTNPAAPGAGPAPGGARCRPRARPRRPVRPGGRGVGSRARPTGSSRGPR